MFPCRGWVAPCQRAAGSIDRRGIGVNGDGSGLARAMGRVGANASLRLADG